MKLEILKENLKLGLNTTERIVGKNLSLPILDNVLLRAEESFLNVVSTDLETAIRVWVLAKIIKKGDAVVPAKLLSSLVSSLPNDKIAIETKDQRMYLTCKNINTQIQGHNPEDFPIIPQFTDSKTLNIDNQKFCQALGQVIDVVSPSPTRPEISGVYIVFSKNTMKAVATDSFRLAEKVVTLESQVEKDCAFILPARPVREVMNILDGKEGVLYVRIANNQMLIELGMKDMNHPHIQITSRLVEGEYPNYQDIIPNKFKTSATIGRDEFLNHIKTASLFSGKINDVKISLNVAKKEVQVFAQNPDLGDNTSSLVATIDGEDISVSFNYKFLIDGLLNMKSSEVVLDISKEEGPCVLRPVGDASYLYVVMPIKSIQ